MEPATVTMVAAMLGVVFISHILFIYSNFDEDEGDEL